MKDLYISNPAIFEEKAKKLKAGGISKLHILSDFDRTLTGDLGEGKIPPTSWSIFVNEFGNIYAEKRQALFGQYHPIEIDIHADIEYKSQQMLIWFREHLEVLVEQGVTIDIIKKILSAGEFKLRNGVTKLLTLAHDKDIPFLIFSAALGDIVQFQLKTEQVDFENIHVLSNFFQFDERGKAIGFQHEIVHTFNKTERLLNTKEYKDKITNRPNCIILGDSIYDASMADGMSHDVILKIGFLNGNIAQRNEFTKVYDVLVEKDTNMDTVNDLIFDILTPSTKII